MEEIKLNMDADFSNFLSEKCHKITRKFINKKTFEIFKNRVDEKEAHKYYEVIEEPMWLTEVNRKIKNRLYKKLDQYVHDMNLIWSNAIAYNGDKSLIGILAQCGQYKFNKELQELTTTKQDEHLYDLKKYSEQISFYTQYLQKELDHVPIKYEVSKV